MARRVRKNRASKNGRKIASRRSRKSASPRRASGRRRSASRKNGAQGNATNNRRAAWTTYQQLQNEVDRAWAKLQADIRNNANGQTLNKDKNRLMVLLGECNYMARECMRCAKSRSR